MRSSLGAIGDIVLIGLIIACMVTLKATHGNFITMSLVALIMTLAHLHNNLRGNQ